MITTLAKTDVVVTGDRILLPKTFSDLRKFAMKCKKDIHYELGLFNENSPYPRWIMRLEKPEDHITFLKIMEEGSNPIQSIRIRFPNNNLGIHSWQVGVFNIQEYEDHKDVVPAIIFDMDKSIYDDCKMVQELLIEILNNEEEYIVDAQWKHKFQDMQDFVLHCETNHDGIKNLFTEATAHLFPKWQLLVEDPEEGCIILKTDERDLEAQRIVKFVWAGDDIEVYVYPFDDGDQEDMYFHMDDDISKMKDVCELGDNADLIADVLLGMINPLMIS